MIELKQLQYFIACAETGSFSKAAERLYTTQPNVSKTIKAMEKEMNVSLFKRGKNGIELTGKGRHVYDHASKVMDEMDFLRDFSDAREDTWLRLSCNPSSKLADLFVEYYGEHKESNLHYRIYSTGINDILQRLRDNKDDMGVVFIDEKRMTSLSYLLMRFHLEFIPLKSVNMTVYFGELLSSEDQKTILSEGKKLQLIQSYYDEILSDKEILSLEDNGKTLGGLDPVIITNSDYIMERILKKTDLANISASSITKMSTSKDMNGNGTEIKERRITFGILCRKSEDLTPWAADFVHFLKSRI